MEPQVEQSNDSGDPTNHPEGASPRRTAVRPETQVTVERIRRLALFIRLQERYGGERR